MNVRSLHACVLAAGLMLAVAAASAADTDAAQPAPAAASLRFRSTESRIEPAALEGGRFRLSARLAPEESAGELREGGGFTLIGRLAKAALACDSGTIFNDSFEGN